MSSFESTNFNLVFNQKTAGPETWFLWILHVTREWMPFLVKGSRTDHDYESAASMKFETHDHETSNELQFVNYQ